ncbi:MAG: hypothetical protein ACXVLQ_03650, partial [Bacteriovorax sp.]
YWFSLKEKHLVEKYLHGDVPQGYNPISESKSVLSRRDNPDKTTSLNTAPANKTQVMRAGKEEAAVIPASSDLEYPDITLVNMTASSQLKNIEAPHAEDMKLPAQEDLEFPDITMISTNANQSMSGQEGHLQSLAPALKPVEVKSRPPEKSEASSVSGEGPIVYPADDDLDYPDMVAGRPKEKIEEEELNFKVNVPAQKAAESTPPPKAIASKSSSRDYKIEIEENSGLTLDMGSLPKEPKESKESKDERSEKKEPIISLMKKEAKEAHGSAALHEDKKLLHERKVKVSAQPAVQKEIVKDGPSELPPRTMPEHLKKRNDNYLMYILVILVLIILSLFFYYYSTILNKPLPV